MPDDEGLWSDEINAFVDAAFESGIVSRNPSDAEQHTAYRYAIKLAIDESRKHGYDHGYYDGSTYQLPQTDALKIAREDEWRDFETAPKDKQLLIVGGEYEDDDDFFTDYRPFEGYALVAWTRDGWQGENRPSHDSWRWHRNFRWKLLEPLAALEQSK